MDKAENAASPDPLQVALAQRMMIRLALVRLAISGGGRAWADTLSGFAVFVPWLVSVALGIGMGIYGYRCCVAKFGKSHALLVAILLVAPFSWMLAVLILNGNITDSLYRHFGAVGFFGVSDTQIAKYKQGEDSNEERE